MMTDNEMLIEVAKLDGWQDIQPQGWWGEQYRWVKDSCLPRLTEDLPSYLTSRDAIIPVIEKVLGNDEELWSKFLHELGCLVGMHKGMEVGRWQLMKRFMLATPEQLTDALLKATGKWKV